MRRALLLLALAAAGLVLVRRRTPVPPRVQLGFRDGSTAELDPASAQAVALRLLAERLVTG